jgi:hypothetical protein
MSGQKKGGQQPGDNADKAVLEGNAEKAVMEDKQLDEIHGGLGADGSRIPAENVDIRSLDSIDRKFLMRRGYVITP